MTRGRGEGGPVLGCGERPGGGGQPRGEQDGRASEAELRTVACTTQPEPEAGLTKTSPAVPVASLGGQKTGTTRASTGRQTNRCGPSTGERYAALKKESPSRATMRANPEDTVPRRANQSRKDRHRTPPLTRGTCSRRTNRCTIEAGSSRLGAGRRAGSLCAAG